MLSRLSSFSGPLSSVFSSSREILTGLILSLDSLDYDFYGKLFTFDSVASSGVTYSSNSVTSQTGGGWNDKGISVEKIPLGSPFKLKFKRGETLGDIMCGVSQTPPIDNQATYTRSSFGFYLGAGTGGASRISLTEGGYFSINETNGSYPASTVYSIIFDGIRVKYYIDDNLFYTSSSVPTNDLFLYILFLQNDKSIIDIEFGATSPIWNDISGNANDFNLINSPKYSNGSFNFNNGLSQSATGSDLGTLNKFAIDTWFKLNSLPATEFNIPQILTDIYETGGNLNFSLGFQTDFKIFGGFFIYPNWYYTDGFLPEINTWYNVTLTYDEEYLNLYLNGNTYSSTNYGLQLSSGGLGINIGKRFDLPEFIDGEIDIVRIWSGTLSSTQILNNYNSISPRYVFATASIVLNGSSSIEVPTGNEFNLGTSYTIEFWSKAATSSTAGQIFTVMSQRDSDSSIDIFYQSGNLVIRNGVVVTAEPTPGVWTHVAIVSNNTTLSVYYNGLSQSVSGSGGNLSNNKYGLSIGCRGPLNNFQYFNGSLYGIRINNGVVYSTDFNPYEVALPPTNIPDTVLLINEYSIYTGNFIDSSYNKTLVNKGTDVSDADLPEIPVGFTADGLILRYDIGDTDSYSGTTSISDLQGNSNATLVDGPTYSINGYLNFDGVNDYVMTNTSLNSKLSPVNTSTVISYFTWIYPQDDGVIITEQGTYSLNSGWHDSQIEIVSGTLKFRVWNGIGITSSIPISLYNWYYVGLTYDGSTLRAYINNQLAGTTTGSRLTPWNSSSNNGLHYAIGASDSTSLGDGTFAKMKLGSFHVYNTSLNQQQILNNYNYTKSNYIYTGSMSIWIDANDPASYISGTSVGDLSGNGYTHSLTSGATLSNIDGIKCFDCTTGSKRIVVDGTGPTLSTSGYTYVVWARLGSDNSSFRTLLYTKSPRYTPITIPDSTHPDANKLGYWDTNSRSSGYDISSLVGFWVQYAVVGDNSSQTFYINDSQVGNSISYGSGGTLHDGLGNNLGSSQPFGHVGNMMLYNKKLTQEQIKQNFDALKHVYKNLEIFTTVGTTTWTAPIGVSTVEYLVVAGGGGGGNGYDNAGGGGGGAGMVLSGTISVIPGTSYTITVGDGGNGGVGSQATTPPGRTNASGTVGANSVFSTITALGGGPGLGSRTGGGIGISQVSNTASPTGGSGTGGGSGGKGGGGVTGNGSNNSGTTGGSGGSGIASTITGSSVTYGVGGSGANSGTQNGGTNGTSNRGNGGQGGGALSSNARDGGKGGSGIVIIKYF